MPCVSSAEAVHVQKYQVVATAAHHISILTAAVEFRNNVLALAATAKLYNIPTILTTSLDQGPNGPLLPEIRNMFPNAPLIRRPGEINAWDNTEFVKAVKVSTKHT